MRMECTGVHADVRMDLRMSMCVGMRMCMCAATRVDAWTDMRTDMRMGVCTSETGTGPATFSCAAEAGRATHESRRGNIFSYRGNIFSSDT